MTKRIVSRVLYVVALVIAIIVMAGYMGFNGRTWQNWAIIACMCAAYIAGTLMSDSNERKIK